MALEVRRHAPRFDAAIVKQASLVSPLVPAETRLSGKEFHVWPVEKSFDSLVNLVGFSAMLAPLRYAKLLHTLALSLRFSPRCEQALLDIGPRPVAQASKEIIL